MNFWSPQIIIILHIKTWKLSENQWLLCRYPKIRMFVNDLLFLGLYSNYCPSIWMNFMCNLSIKRRYCLGSFVTQCLHRSLNPKTVEYHCPLATFHCVWRSVQCHRHGIKAECHHSECWLKMNSLLDCFPFWYHLINANSCDIAKEDSFRVVELGFL